MLAIGVVPGSACFISAANGRSVRQITEKPRFAGLSVS
jgi:hypothetical protein